MKTPKFWKDENIISFLLYPFSLIYGIFRNVHTFFSSEYKTNLKIVCIGNLTAGGSGKTPVAIKISDTLKNKNINFAYLSKGYGGSIKQFTKVDLTKHIASEVGDEPLLLAEIADTFISKNRRSAIDILSKNYNYDLIIMDDGFQNPTIYKDKNIVVIDGEYGVGNGELLPSGPLRESLKSATKRTDFFIIIGQDKQNLQEKLINNDIKVVRAYIKEKAIENNNEKYIAFCGLGRPEKFFNSLKKINYNVLKEYSFSDHYFYKEEELSKILVEASKNNAKLITTKKDWVRLPKEYKNNIQYLDIEIKFYDNDEFADLILQ